jgi:pilus assembly protein FimV
LQKDLAIAQETAEAMRQENTDLHNRVAELEKQIQSMQRLITLKDDSFTALQSGVTSQPDVAAPEAVGPEVPQSEAVAPKPTAKPKPVSQPEPEQSFVDQLMADPKLLGLVVGVPILLVLGVVAYLRKRRQGAADEPIPGGMSFESLVATKPQPKSTAATATVSSAGENEFESAVSGLPEYSTSEVGSIHTEETDIDPVAEADVYLAYRRYEQAEALLKEAVRNHPERSELRLKLMEIYHTTKNKEAFEAQAESLYAMAGGQGQVWSQAVEMGLGLCPEHPLFAEASVAVAASDSGTDNNLEFDMSAASLPLSDADLAASLDMGDMNDLGAQSGDALDLDLDLPGEMDLDSGGEQTAANNFDLDASLKQRADDLLSSLGTEEANVDASVADAGESSDWSLEAAVSEFAGSELKSLMPEEEHVVVTAVDADHVEVDESLGLVETAIDVGDLLESTEKAQEGAQEWNLDQAVSQFGPIEEELESTVFDNSDDVVGTKLDLAKAYIDMGDQTGARTILDEVVVEGSEVQRQEAQQLIQQIG